MEARIQFQARIKVPKAGYKWSTNGAGAVLAYRDVPRSDADEADLSQEMFRSCDLFRDEPALFKAFADLEALPWPPNFRKSDDVARFRASVLAFASEYGAPDVNGEFLLAINQEIHLMLAAIDLWEAGRQRNKKVIAKHIQWNKRLGWNLSESPFEYFQLPDEWAEAPDGKDQIFQQAAQLVDAIIAQKCSVPLGMTLVRDAEGVATLSVMIDELLPVLWLQFAFAVAEDKQYRRCEVCKRAFELAPGENRADRRFCSNRCRIRAFRQRKARACEMRVAGEHLRKIARDLDTDLATVKGWVGEA